MCGARREQGGSHPGLRDRKHLGDRLAGPGGRVRRVVALDRKHGCRAHRPGRRNPSELSGNPWDRADGL
jgi:hypothetical protein